MTKATRCYFHRPPLSRPPLPSIPALASPFSSLYKHWVRLSGKSAHLAKETGLEKGSGEGLGVWAEESQERPWVLPLSAGFSVTPFSVSSIPFLPFCHLFFSSAVSFFSSLFATFFAFHSFSFPVFMLLFQPFNIQEYLLHFKSSSRFFRKFQLPLPFFLSVFFTFNSRPHFPFPPLFPILMFIAYFYTYPHSRLSLCFKKVCLFSH